MTHGPVELRTAIQKRGGIEQLPDAPDGPLLPAFDPDQLGNAIISEVLRAQQNGWCRISLHMTLDDALALARALQVR